MSEGLAKTFELLATTENEASVDVLLAALASKHAGVQEAALGATVRRRSLRGQLEIIRRWPEWEDRGREILRQQPGRMTQALSKSLSDGDAQTVENACRASVWLHDYDLLPVLINLLEDTPRGHTDLAAKTLLELADLLYAELASPRDYRNRRDPQLVRRNLTVSLEQAISRFLQHERRELIEAFLLLATRDNCTLQQVLHEPLHSSHRAVMETLSHSERPGVLRLVVSFLEDRTPPLAVLHLIGRRMDAPFVRYLLKRLGHEHSPLVLQNLKRISTFSWLEPRHAVFDALEENEQAAAVRLLMASNVEPPQAFACVEYLLRHGKAAARCAACLALAEMPGLEAHGLLLAALSDAEPSVQATAVEQLAKRDLAGVLPRLIEMIDSPHEEVRTAVRESLVEFQFKRFLASYDLLEPAVRISTAPLVRKIDPDYRDLLLAEMACSARTRRLRSIEIAEIMQVVDDVQPRLLELLQDEDHLVRSEAARVLARSDSPAVQQALERALLDRSTLVQESVKASLLEINRRALVQRSAPLVASRELAS